MDSPSPCERTDDNVKTVNESHDLESDEDDYSDLPPGPHLKPTKITPELQKKIDEASERLHKRFGHLKK